jgi:hypothetical protein
MTDEGREAVQGSGEERELAGYLEQLISTALQSKAATRSVERWEADEFGPTAPTMIGSLDMSRTPESLEGNAGLTAAQRKSPPPYGRSRRTGRASMSEGLAALFRPTERPLPPRPSRTAPPTRSMAGDSRRTANGPSEYLQRFLRQADQRNEVAPSGLAELDARLDGGFGSGLHLVLARPADLRASFLDSIAWESVTSGRPVIYYSLRGGSLSAWERLVSALGSILGGPTIPRTALRTRCLGPDHLETLTRLDRVLQNSVLPFLSLVETIPAHQDLTSAFLGDARSRAQESEERHGKTPLVLVDDLEHLLLLSDARPTGQVLARLDGALVADSIPGVIASTPPDRADPSFRGLPARSALVLEQAPGLSDEAFGRVDLELLANTHTGWTGSLPLVLDHLSGLFSVCPLAPEGESVVQRQTRVSFSGLRLGGADRK